jgi:ubiquinone/menaquinone biosynthesis C-methylase UbiE
MRASGSRAEARAEMPDGIQATLNARTLPTAHHRLHECLQPGLRVLDVGCGTGAITRDIAKAVAPSGVAVGVDASAMLVEEARRRHRTVPNLSFEEGDIYELNYQNRFDMTHAARVLQWLARPEDALRSMASVTKPSGRVIVLDYNHEKIEWVPELPEAMRLFYEAFLRWRTDASMDNAIADHLKVLMGHIGLNAIRETPQHEHTQRSDADFEQRAGLWAEVAATRGHQMVRGGVLSEAQRAAAEVDYRRWVREEAEAVRLYLLSVEAKSP